MWSLLCPASNSAQYCVSGIRCTKAVVETAEPSNGRVPIDIRHCLHCDPPPIVHTVSDDNRRLSVYCKRFTIKEPTNADARARKLQFRVRHMTLYAMESHPVCSTFDCSRSCRGIGRPVGVHQDSGDGVAASTECVKSCHDRDLQGRTVPAE